MPGSTTHVTLVAVASLSLATCLSLGACGSGGGGGEQAGAIPAIGVQSGTGDLVPLGAGADPRPSGLRVDTRRLCTVPGETFELPVTAVAFADDGTETTGDVSARVTPTTLFGDSLELLAQGDGGLVLRMREPDISGLTLDFEGSSLTLYVGAFPDDAPDTVLMKKPLGRGSCLYALRETEGPFCGTALSRAGSDRVSLGIGGGITVDFTGCEHTAPPELPLIEFAAEPAGAPP